jgi:hypothetical protein
MLNKEQKTYKSPQLPGATSARAGTDGQDTINKHSPARLQKKPRACAQLKPKPGSLKPATLLSCNLYG